MKYTEYRITVMPDQLERVENALAAAGFDSLMIDDPADIQDIIDNKEAYRYDYINDSLTENRSRCPVIFIYLDPQSETAEEELKALRSATDSLGDAIEGIEEIEADDGDWLYTWKDFFKPARVTEKLVVKPTWEEYEPAEGDLVIEIDPGMAFGTGTHETTSLCLKAIEKAMTGGYGREMKAPKVLDVGCGSGILAIGAALLGASEALGIEIDTDAVDIAKENVSLNGLSDVVEVRYGDLTKGVDYKADIVVANLMADLVVMLTPDVAGHLKDGGIYISSGILCEKEEAVSKAIKESGYDILEILEDGDWCSIVAQRKK